MAISYDRDVAQDIYAVGQRMGVTDDVMLAGLAAALVESNMSNVDYGDRDSLGVFQQRPSQGWGTAAQVQRPRYAARQFFQAAEGVDDYSNVGDLAQQVQRSAYPDRYQQRLDDAQRILSRLQGGGGSGGGARVQAAAGSAFTPIAEDDANEDAVLLASMLQSMSRKMRGAVDPTQTPEERQVEGAFGDSTGAPAPVEGENAIIRDEAEAMRAAGDTQTGTKARTDPNYSPMAWGGFDNGKIPLSEMVKVQSNGATHYLAPEAAQAFLAARRAAKRDGVKLTITDSYRSYADQVAVAKAKGLYDNGGLAATPGQSIHGWGKALDIDEGQEWMAENGARFGFETIDREPWHWQLGGS